MTRRRIPACYRGDRRVPPDMRDAFLHTHDIPILTQAQARAAVAAAMVGWMNPAGLSFAAHRNQLFAANMLEVLHVVTHISNRHSFCYLCLTHAMCFRC